MMDMIWMVVCVMVVFDLVCSIFEQCMWPKRSESAASWPHFERCSGVMQLARHVQHRSFAEEMQTQASPGVAG